MSLRVAIVLLSASLVGSIALSILIGPVSSFDTELFRSVVWAIRLPRIATAFLAGWSLALAGLCLQSLLKNPLASEYTLGISSGAAIGALLSFLLQADFPMAVPLFAFAGSLATVFFVFAIARFGLSSDSLILSGIILTSFGNALVSIILSVISPNQLHTFFFWFMGSFAGAQWSSIASALPLIGIGSVLIFLLGWEMNALSIGDDAAQQVGISVRRTKVLLYISSSLLTAVIVSFTGTIGFIGLVVPHLARLLVGYNNRLLVCIAPLLGAAFCVLSDLLARTVLYPMELPVGVVTACIGVPVFLYFNTRRKAWRC